MPFVATQMNLEIIILSEVSQRQISYDIAYMWNLKKKKNNDTGEIIYKIETDSQTFKKKKNYGYQRRKGKERDKLGIWD